jgi:hypothetical protein
MMSRVPAQSSTTFRRSAESSNTIEGAHAIADLQRTVTNPAGLRVQRHGAPRYADTARVPPFQVDAPCACDGSCPRCSHEERFERDALLTPSQDDMDFTEGVDVDTETRGVGMSPPDIESPAERAEGASAAPPLEEGWWTGNWYTGSNTIICDGSGSLTINEATSYKHGVQDCTRKHESSHRSDWYGRYGNEICKGRKKGDLPHFDPKGKEAYADFLKASECAAWKIGQTCRNEKLAACADDACKSYVKTFTTQADSEVKNYCG